ncbi:hypothetical protein ACQPZQ_15540 [Pseudonocardia sp. CA-142604]|uniref:hypothetical protein n=1 Tax=Pseudonocardia sp. CA-142604 TaxID=3240024 RepID=UPI003D90E3CB
MPEAALVVDDLLLVLLDGDEVPAGVGTLYHPLGGALLVDLALAGRIAPKRGAAAPRDRLSSPAATARCPTRSGRRRSIPTPSSPARARTLMLRIGSTLWAQ